MPPMPPMPPAGAEFPSGLSTMTTAVVRNSAAMDAAFCSAERVTLAGSMIPSLIRSTYSPVEALSPQPGLSPRTGAVALGSSKQTPRYGCAVQIAGRVR